MILSIWLSVINRVCGRGFNGWYKMGRTDVHWAHWSRYCVNIETFSRPCISKGQRLFHHRMITWHVTWITVHFCWSGRHYLKSIIWYPPPPTCWVNQLTYHFICPNFWFLHVFTSNIIAQNRKFLISNSLGADLCH